MSSFRCPLLIPVTYRGEFPDSVRQRRIEGGTGGGQTASETLTWAEMHGDIRSIRKGFSQVREDVDKRSKTLTARQLKKSTMSLDPAGVN